MPSWGTPSERFGLENGGKQLMRWFSQVNLHLVEDHLSVTVVEPLIRYMKSMFEGNLPKDGEVKIQEVSKRINGIDR